MIYTLNRALSAKKLLAGRVAELQRVRQESLIKKRTSYDGRENVDEPTFDPSAVDTMVTKIELAIYDLDGEIKAKNATTNIEVDVDVEALLAPIPPKQ